jgi:hypothetical protein
MAAWVNIDGNCMPRVVVADGMTLSRTIAEGQNADDAWDVLRGRCQIVNCSSRKISVSDHLHLEGFA